MHLELFPLLAASTDSAPSAFARFVEQVVQVLGPFGVKPVMLLAQIVNFSVLSAIIYYFAIRPVLATVDERNKKIEDGLRYTKEMQTQKLQADQQVAEKLKAAGQESTRMVTEAREAAKVLVEKGQQEAAHAAELVAKKAAADLANEREQMLLGLRREVGQLVVNTTSRVLGRDLTNDERSRFAAGAAQDLTKN